MRITPSMLSGSFIQMGSVESIRIFEPDIVLPSQGSDLWKGSQWSGVKSLCFEVLKSGYLDLSKPHSMSCRNKHKKAYCNHCTALEWLYGLSEDTPEIFTFENLCGLFGFDVTEARRKFLLAPQNHLYGRPQIKHQKEETADV